MPDTNDTLTKTVEKTILTIVKKADSEYEAVYSRPFPDAYPLATSSQENQEDSLESAIKHVEGNLL